MRPVEKRHDKAPASIFGGGPFRSPANVAIIGALMQSADRMSSGMTNACPMRVDTPRSDWTRFISSRPSQNFWRGEVFRPVEYELDIIFCSVLAAGIRRSNRYNGRESHSRFLP